MTRELAALREELKKLTLEKHRLQKQIDEKFNQQVARCLLEPPTSPSPLCPHPKSFRGPSAV